MFDGNSPLVWSEITRCIPPELNITGLTLSRSITAEQAGSLYSVGERCAGYRAGNHPPSVLTGLAALLLPLPPIGSRRRRRSSREDDTLAVESMKWAEAICLLFPFGGVQRSASLPPARRRDRGKHGRAAARRGDHPPSSLLARKPSMQLPIVRGERWGTLAPRGKAPIPSGREGEPFNNANKTHQMMPYRRLPAINHEPQATTGQFPASGRHAKTGPGRN